MGVMRVEGRTVQLGGWRRLKAYCFLLPGVTLHFHCFASVACARMKCY